MISLQVFLVRFELGAGYDIETLNDFSHGKQWILCPLDFNISLVFASGNIEGLGETKFAIFLGVSH